MVCPRLGFLRRGSLLGGPGAINEITAAILLGFISAVRGNVRLPPFCEGQRVPRTQTCSREAALQVLQLQLEIANLVLKAHDARLVVAPGP
jgi:hypothetical protein